MPPLEDLKKDIAEGRAVLVVGAGVAMQATGGQACASWTGLLRNGARYCVDLDSSLRDKWLGKVESDIDSDDPEELILAAERVTSKLGGRSGGPYRSWLKQSVGALTVKERAVIEAIHKLGVGIATTNYDGLIEEVTGLNPITWRNRAEVEEFLQGREETVLHLHGYHSDPQSVVLGIRSYEEVLGDEHAQTSLRSLLLTKTLVFVGFGAGLKDPNFGALLQWRLRYMSGASRCYLLALDKDCPALRKEPPLGQGVVVLSYGNDYSDLPAFLLNLSPKVASPDRPPAVPTLPGPRAHFGRDAEIQTLVDHLLAPASQAPPFPVLGGPGIGKTTITITALHHPEVAKRYGPRRYFVRCEAASSRSALAFAIARQMGIDPAPNVEPVLLAGLGEAPAVLVLDNFETPWEADQSEVEEFLTNLSAVGELRPVASVRGSERPGGGVWSEALLPDRVSLPAARQAFLNIAGQKFKADTRLDPLLEEVDRVPLAVTLLAHAAEPEPNLGGVWQRWQEERTAMLRRGRGTDRLTNLELSYEISVKSPRMTDESRRLLSVLALLPNGVAHSHLASIVPGGGLAAATALRRTGLAYDEGERLRLLGPVREYISRHYPPDPQELDKAAGFYRGLVCELGNRVGSEGGGDAARILMPEAANIEAIFLRNLRPAAIDELVNATKAWGEFARFTGVGSVNLLEEVVAMVRKDGNALALAGCLESLGYFYLDRSRHAEARQRYEEARRLYRQVGNVLGEANCIKGVGDIALERSDHAEAQRLCEEAQPLYRQVGSVWGEADCIKKLGDIALARSDHAEAQRRYQEAQPLYRQVGSASGEANCIRRLGDIALARSDHAEALRRYGEAGPLYRQIGAGLGEANCILRMGDIALQQSDPDEARIRFEECLAMYERVQEPYSIGGTHRRLARIAPAAEIRAHHVQAAREAWLRIDRPDLIKQLDDEFGPPPAAS